MLNRILPPLNLPLDTLTLPQAEISFLANGVRLHCLYNQQHPVVKFEIVLKAGKWYEPQKGVSYFTAKMLLEGTNNFSARQLAEKVAYYGASLECNQGFDRATITLYCLSKHFQYLLPPVLEIFTQPTFPEKELEILKTRTLQNITVEKEKNSYLATLLLTRNIYGAMHPYLAGMEQEAITSITKYSLQDFFNTHFKKPDIDLFLSGGFDQYLVNSLIYEVENSINNSSLSNQVISHLAISSNERKHYNQRPEKLQSSIRIGRSWPLMKEADHPKLSLLNKILGGYFGSRLMKNIREDKGFTYGIFSSISTKEHDALFYIGTDVKAENTDQTLEEVYKEINRLIEIPVSDEEMQTVKNYTVGKFLNDTATVFDQVDKYKTTVFHQLPANYFKDFIFSIQNTTSDELQYLANRYLQEGDLFEVVVGNK